VLAFLPGSFNTCKTVSSLCSTFSVNKVSVKPSTHIKQSRKELKKSGGEEHARAKQIRMERVIGSMPKSGKTQIQWCRENEINVRTFQDRKSKIKREEGLNPKSAQISEDTRHKAISGNTNQSRDTQWISVLPQHVFVNKKV